VNDIYQSSPRFILTERHIFPIFGLRLSDCSPWLGASAALRDMTPYPLRHFIRRTRPLLRSGTSCSCSLRHPRFVCSFYFVVYSSETESGLRNFDASLKSKNVLNTIPKDPDTEKTRFTFAENTIFPRKSGKTRIKHENIFFLPKNAKSLADTVEPYGVGAGSGAPRRFFHKSQKLPNPALRVIKNPVSQPNRFPIVFKTQFDTMATQPKHNPNTIETQ
jgi:hypothetical protein